MLVSRIGEATVDRAGWGPWQLDRHTRVLRATTGDDRYEVDLDNCTSSGETLDWIYQIANKPWANDEIIAGLIRAIGDVLNPQENLCPHGNDFRLTPDAIQTLVRRAR
jgi:hypothetical protein